MMRLRANGHMQLEILHSLASNTTLPDELARVADAGIVVDAGCYFLSACYNPSYAPVREHIVDCTGLECFVNKVHIDDYAESSWLSVAVRFAWRILERLSSEYPQEAFCLIVSVDDTSCTTRFHCIRPGEFWLSEDLEAYKQEALLAITCGTA